MKKFYLLTILVFAAAGIGCSTYEAANYNGTQNPAQAQAAQPAPDNSEITTSVAADGTKTETRTFKNNPRISKVVVTTHKDGTRTVKAISPSGEEREVKTDENVLEATGDKVAEGAGFVAEKSKDAVGEAGDKAEDVKDKTVSTTKKVANEVGDKAEDVKDKTVSTTKTVGQKSVEGAKKVGDKTVEGAKKAGSAVKKVIP